MLVEKLATRQETWQIASGRGLRHHAGHMVSCLK